MSQSITFFQFDEPNVNQFWEDSLESKFAVTTTQSVTGLPDLIRQIKDGDYDEDLESAIWELDDLIVNHFSHRRFHEYEMEVRDTVNFWLNIQTGKSLDDDFAGDYEAIDVETWQRVFSSPKKLAEIRERVKTTSSLQIPLSAHDLLNYYLQIKVVFEYSQLTDTEMLALPEDSSISQRWSHRINTLKERAVPVLKALQEESKRAASEYRKPPFITIPLSSKEFFMPTVYVIRDGKSYSLDYEELNSGELQHDIWASRVLPGETYELVLQRELNESLGYTGDFQVIPMKALLDQAPDNSGMIINRYRIQIKLTDPLDISKEVMGYRLKLKPENLDPYRNK